MSIIIPFPSFYRQRFQGFTRVFHNFQIKRQSSEWEKARDRIAV